MSVYSKVPIKKPGRNAFTGLTHTYYGCLNIGELKPIARPIEAVPGDTFITGNISEIELSPVITNFKGDLYFETWQFFVSNDMLYVAGDSGKFTDIIASLQNPQNILSLPYFSTTYAGTDKNNIASYIYGNIYIGSQINTNKHLLGYPFRAPFKIWNEWFRDENLQSEVSGTGITVLYVNYKKDRYTSAFLDTQKGTTIKFNTGVQNLQIKSVLPYDLLNRTTNSYPSLLADDRGSSTIVNPLFVNSNNMTQAQVDAFNQNFMKIIAASLQTNPTGTGITINDLRLYNKLQKWQERNQLCGTRIKEYLLANYGVTPNDETLQRPVLIGHTKTPVIVDPIVSNIKQTNQSSIPTLNQQGSRGGIASASSSYKYGKWFCKEFGWIITLGALRPKAVYGQGVHKSLRRDSIIDFFNPIFEHLGQQPIVESEIFFTNTSVDDQLLGYQDIYNEMRHMEDFIAPELSDILPNYNLWRKFANPQTLGSSFITVNPNEYDYLFALPHSSAPHAIFTSHNIIKAIRPISKRSTPTLA